MAPPTVPPLGTRGPPPVVHRQIVHFLTIIDHSGMSVDWVIPEIMVIPGQTVLVPCCFTHRLNSGGGQWSVIGELTSFIDFTDQTVPGYLEH